MGMAAREELLEAINEYKESGKWVFAYSDTYMQGDYMIATSADSILLNPVGAVDIHGVGGVTPFFTGLLDKLGVKMQIIKVGTYKSAVEPYILKEMSGVIVTSALIAIVLTFGFWYLLHVIKRLRTIEEMKDDFTNNMTHELKTPIAIAYAANDSLLQFPDPNDEERTKSTSQPLLSNYPSLPDWLRIFLP